MLAKKDLRKLAREIGAELKNVMSIMRSYGGSNILVTKNNGRSVMYTVNYVSGKRIRTTIKPGSIAHRDLIENIILEARTQILKGNYDAIVAAGKSYTDYCDREVAARVKSRYPSMDTELIYDVLDYMSDKVKNLSDWARYPYKQFKYKEETKIHTTSRGLKVRSKSELALCELFYELGLEFRYEEEIILGGRAFGPDFTIRRKSDGKIFYWEHCGMMDVSDYRRRNAERLSVYEGNGIVPWDNLIITYDSEGSIDLSLAEAIAGAVLCI